MSAVRLYLVVSRKAWLACDPNVELEKKNTNSRIDSLIVKIWDLGFGSEPDTTLIAFESFATNTGVRCISEGVALITKANVALLSSRL